MLLPGSLNADVCTTYRCFAPGRQPVAYQRSLGTRCRNAKNSRFCGADRVVEVVPELKLIIGEQPPVPDLPPQDAQRRFQLVFRRFISVFARAEHPLALFFDDLQWLDVATLDFLENLLTQPDVHHLMLIGAYRDNEIDSAHPLWRKLEAIRHA